MRAAVRHALPPFGRMCNVAATFGSGNTVGKAGKTPDFEQSLGELEQLVERLERGDLPLDEALKTFERGVALTRQCQQALKSAQAKVEILVSRGDATTTETFESNDDTE